jgi:hypothetical protein
VIQEISDAGRGSHAPQLDLEPGLSRVRQDGRAAAGSGVAMSATMRNTLIAGASPIWSVNARVARIDQALENNQLALLAKFGTRWLLHEGPRDEVLANVEDAHFEEAVAAASR